MSTCILHRPPLLSVPVSQAQLAEELRLHTFMGTEAVKRLGFWADQTRM